MRRPLSFSRIFSTMLASILLLTFAPVPANAADDDIFVVNDIRYEVISEAQKTVRVAGISDDFDYKAVSGVVTIPQEVTNAGANYTVTEVQNACFESNLDILDILLPDSITTIGYGAFYGCASLERLIIPDAVTSLDSIAIVNCENLQEVILPASLTDIDADELFLDCPKLASISITKDSKFYTRDGVLYCRENLFQKEGISETDDNGNLIFDQEMSVLVKYPVAKPGPFSIPDGVEVIGRFAFRGTSMTTQLTVPDSVKLVNRSAFYSWQTLESITFLGETPPVFVGSVLLNAAKKGLMVYVPTEECIEIFEVALANSKPAGKVAYEPNPNPQKPGDSGPDDNGGNDPGGNNPGGNDPGGNNPGGNDPGGNDPGGNDPGGNSGANNSPNSNINGNSVWSYSPGWLSGVGTDYGSTRTTPDYRSLQTMLAGAIRAANEANSSEASLTITNYQSLSLDTLKQLAAAAEASGKSCVLSADVVEDGVVQIRIMFDPNDATKTILLSGSVNSAGAQAIDALFEKSFQNKVAVVELSQQGGFGITVTIAARVDLTGLNKKRLYFYAYDKATNTYARIKNPKYRIDKNGYLWFNTTQGGFVIVSDKPLRAIR